MRQLFWRRPFSLRDLFDPPGEEFMAQAGIAHAARPVADGIVHTGTIAGHRRGACGVGGRFLVHLKLVEAALAAFPKLGEEAVETIIATCSGADSEVVSGSGGFALPSHGPAPCAGRRVRGCWPSSSGRGRRDCRKSVAQERRIACDVAGDMDERVVLRRQAGDISPYRHFTRTEWAAPGGYASTLTIEDLTKLHRSTIRFPSRKSSRFIFHCPACWRSPTSPRLRACSRRRALPGAEDGKVPYIIGRASVAVGKSTTARVLQALLSPAGPTRRKCNWSRPTAFYTPTRCSSAKD